MDTKKIRPAESGNDAKREKVRVIPIQFFDDFPGHPFYVKMDEEMKVLMESIKEFGSRHALHVSRMQCAGFCCIRERGPGCGR